MEPSHWVVEFKALHEKSKAGTLTDEEQERWAELLRRLNAPPPAREPREWDPEAEPLD